MADTDPQPAEQYRFADLILDVDAVRVRRGETEIELPKLSFDLLVALARHSPAVVSFDQLMDEVWGDVVVGPETVTQRVKLVRNALGDDSAAPRYIAPVRGRGYRLVSDAVPVDADDAEARVPRRPMVTAIAILVVAAIGAWYYGSTPPEQEPPAPAADPHTIAILPFANMSDDPANDPLTDGIHDDVLMQVSQIGALKVISRTSVELLDRDRSIPEIAALLGVATVLEGSVQRAGDSLRINVQLIDGASDHHLWSQTYDRELSAANVFFIQTDIATQIARSLEATLTRDEMLRFGTPPTENFAAYEAYLLGRQHMRNRNTAELEKAEAYFRQAIRLDEQYAKAYLGLAETQLLLSSYGTLPAWHAGTRADSAVTYALAFDDQLGEAYALRGRLATRRTDFEEAEADFRTAMRLAPNHPETHSGYAEYLSFRNRLEESLERYRVARQLDPLSGEANADLGAALMHAGHYAEALAQFEKTVAIAPDYAGGYRGIAELNWTVLGRLDEAYAWRLKILDIDPGDPVNPAVIGMICLDLGDPDLAEYWIDRALALGAERRRPYWAKEALHMNRGEDVEALDYANRVMEIDASFHYTVTHLRNVDVRNGRIDDAIARYRRIFPRFLDAPDPEILFWNYIAAIDIAYLVQQAGDQERASMLLGKSLRAIDDVRRLGPRGFAIADVEIYALQGKDQLALATLREAVESGWRMHWWFWLDLSPNLDGIRGDTEFKAIREIITTDMAEQLERVLMLQATL